LSICREPVRTLRVGPVVANSAKAIRARRTFQFGQLAIV
jgi:hypothetical protein